MVHGAKGGTRTPTPVKASGPKPGASTNFATFASGPAVLSEARCVPRSTQKRRDSIHEFSRLRDSFVRMGVNHYENFPVASVLMPARLRGAVKAIYRFARTADDLADEGTDPPAQRLEKLDVLEHELDAIETGRPHLWPDLAQAIAQHQLPIALLRDLLSAFRQDVATHRYPNTAALFDYCRRSANPIGRLLLHLYGKTQAPLLAWSDAICTGLQLTNFWQDVAIDWRKGRVYVPLDALSRHGLSTHAIDTQCSNTQSSPPTWRNLMREQCAATRALLESGAPLATALGGRVGWELRLVVQGGLRILERIDAVHGDVFRHRPQLQTADWALMLWRALTMRPQTLRSQKVHS